MSRSTRTAPLWELRVPLPEGAEELLSPALEAHFGTPPVFYSDAATGATHAQLYLPRRWPDTAEARSRLRSRLAALVPKLPRAIRWEQRRLGARDWAESWKHHFKPISIPGKLLIKPGWSRRRPTRGQQVVRLDPGLSFGTGQHPTTRFCLEQVAAFSPASLLDAGTGSGILAIAAARLGCRPVIALELDADALRIARDNARRNRVLERITFEQADVTAWRAPCRFQLICANLTADLLLSLLPKLPAWLEPQGRLVVAGILHRQFAGVRAACRRAGLELRKSRTETEWTSGLFQRRLGLPLRETTQ